MVFYVQFNNQSKFVFIGGGGDWQMVWVAEKREIEKKIEKDERLKIERECKIMKEDREIE